VERDCECEVSYVIIVYRFSHSGVVDKVGRCACDAVVLDTGCMEGQLPCTFISSIIVVLSPWRCCCCCCHRFSQFHCAAVL